MTIERNVLQAYTSPTEPERSAVRDGKNKMESQEILSNKIDETDRQILMLLQRGLPFETRPYQSMAEEIGNITEEEILQRIAALKEKKVIRRMSGFFNSEKLGYVSALCAIAVAEQHIDEVAGFLEHFPGITHNYLRNHFYNMWFTLICSSETEMQTILDLIEQQPHVEKVLRFVTEKKYKINVTFDLKGGKKRDDR